MCIDELTPQRVFHYFSEIAAIPHGSRNTSEISEYIVKFAKDHNFKYRQDELGNVIIWKPAQNCTTSETVILQGHLDMVCEKEPNYDIDMEAEGLKLCVDGDELKAIGTTLGGDDGIAVAMMLAILEDMEMTHPNIEAVFTVDEEIGMLGAAAIDTSDIKGHIMLNIDSEEEGVFTVSCAGGVVAECELPIEVEQAEGMLVQIKVGGLIGGHSGIEIHKNRANANVLMGRTLQTLRDSIGIKLVDIDGGAKDNAIPIETIATVMLTGDNLKDSPDILDAVYSLLRSLRDTYASEYATTDPDVSLLMRPLGELAPYVMTRESTDRVIAMLRTLPNGIQRMSPDVSGLVQTSLNMGILETESVTRMNCYAMPCKTPVKVTATYCVRSSVASEKNELTSRLCETMKMLGGKVTLHGDYPGWEYNKTSVLRDIMVSVYSDQYGESPAIEAVHAGVECGYFAAKIDGLDCVSYGPMLKEIHTYRESMNIPSVERTYNMTKEVLRRLAR